MSPALARLETMVASRSLRHGGNPVLNMCAQNAVATSDPAGNRKLDKSKTSARIDGMVALAMAVGSMASDAPKQAASYLETEGLMVL
jgi:phage terminase large subunit-like protein